MFWGAIIKEGQPLRATKMFESMEFPSLHLSQAVLVKGKDARLTVKQKDQPEIVISLLND
jgi:hypothetical protein